MIKNRLSALLLPVLLAACAGDIQAPEKNPLPQDSKAGPGLFSGESGNILDAFRPGGGGEFGTSAGLNVNGYLWRASLEAVSFLPVVQADSAGGVIVTDWYASPEKPDERVKLNVYILGKSLRPQSLRVTVFKQQKAKDGWTDTTASDSTARQLEDTILTRARVLRVKDKASN
ncbi:MAG: DUF3576 domain-containing protein [Proteobacteria bacterium]|nr:DUF3576 domain-containing protein [Pseudomonadota bacterium]